VADVTGSFATSAVPGTRFIHVRHVVETGSTNRDLLAEAASGAPEGLVLVADHQTAGRGRLDRTWVAPPGASLLASVLLRPALPADELFLLTLACAMAAIEAVDEIAGVRPGLKWPNDLVVTDGPLADRKLAGILAESHVAGGRVDAVVVGMGLNLDWPEVLHDDLAATAASVNHLTGTSVDREAVCVAWLRHYDGILDALAEPDRRDVFLSDVRRSSATIGRRVRVERDTDVFEGDAVDITAAGHLVVDPGDGSPAIEVTVADIVHLRHA
jgi:BirA family transcriptional regulator, biotin operon repressor / biotin---[acetyl-CoA-carboxylase] ligase